MPGLRSCSLGIFEILALGEGEGFSKANGVWAEGTTVPALKIQVFCPWIAGQGCVSGTAAILADIPGIEPGTSRHRLQ